MAPFRRSAPRLSAALPPLAAVIATATATTVVAQPAADRVAPIIQGAVGTALDRSMQRAAAQGMRGTVLVARGDTILLRQGYGTIAVGDTTPIDVDQPFAIGSLTKQFTATAILALVADGRLALTDSIGRFFPEAPARTRGITVEQLLAHRGGLPYIAGALASPTLSRRALLLAMLEEPLAHPPGTKHAYSNAGYSVLAGIVEAVTGDRYERFAESRLFARAGLRRTVFPGTRAALPAAALQLHSYTGDDDEGPLATFPTPALIAGAGDMISTVDDLYRWGRALHDGHVLPDEWRDRLFTPVTPTDQPSTQYAFGWQVITSPVSGRIVMHAGDLGGYNVEYRHYLDRNLTIIHLGSVRTRGSGARAIIANELSNVAQGRAGLPLPAVAADVAAAAQALAGRYRVAGGDTVVLRAERDGVVAVVTHPQAYGALFATDSATRPTAAALALATDSVLQRLSSGSTAPLVERFHPSARGGDVAAVLTTLRRELIDSLGPWQGHRVLGTRMYGPASAISDAVVTFARGEVGVSVAWEQGMIFTLTPRNPAAVTLRLVPESTTRAAAFDLMSGRLVRLEASGTTLTIETPGGTTTAERLDARSARRG